MAAARRSCIAGLAALVVVVRANADAVPPTVTGIMPPPGSTLGSEPASIVVTFSEEVDASTISTDTVKLIRSGGDGTFGDGNEVAIAPASVLRTAANEATMDLTGAKLPNDVYTVRVVAVDSTSTYIVADLETGMITRADSIADLLTNDAYKTTKLVLRLISAGTFQMGDEVGGHEADELPVHTVNITKPFYMGVFQVTQRQWYEVQGTWPSNFTTDPDKRPVEMVTWGDCQGFLAQLSSETGLPFHLPTEAEWEYACKAGTSTNHSYGDTGDGAWMWYTPNSGNQTHEVATTTNKPNPWGLYDTHGNVWEWCEDRYAADYYSSSPTDDPQGPASGTYHALRGGSYRSPANSCRSANRAWPIEGPPSSNVGLRAVVRPYPSVVDLAGNVLDGEYLGGFPSGNGSPGGSFVSTFTIDAPLPTVTNIVPAPDAVLGGEPGSVVVTFSKGMDAATVNTGAFRLVASGLDGTFGDGNEVEIVPDSVTLTPPNVATMDLTSATLPDDVYQVTIDGSGLSGGLFAHWRLDEESGGFADDSSGNGNHGTLGGNPQWAPSGGMVGGALDFDGNGDYVEIPTQDQNIITVAAWVNLVSSGQSSLPRILATPGYSLVVWTGTDRISFEANWTSIGRWQVVEPLIGAGWKHIAVTYDGSSPANEAVIYVDGVAQTTENVDEPSGTLAGNAGTGVIGNRLSPRDRSFDGPIDEMHIYSRVLAGEEIALLAAIPPQLDVTDLAGNLLDGEYTGTLPSGDGTAGGGFVCTFTVEAVAPTVVSTSPADEETEVDAASNAVVTFSELMNEAATEGAFSIDGGVTGTFSWAANVMTFDPDADLASDTTYTVTISTAATDLDGKNLQAPYVFSFTTPDTIAPRVTVVTADAVPLPGATLSASPSSIVVTFDEDMDGATVNADTFKLIASGGDGTFGDGDEVVIAPDLVTLTPPNVATMDLGTLSLEDDEYQVIVGEGWVSDTGLVAHWRVDDGSGQTATDATGNGNDGTLGSTGGVDVDDPSWVGGKVGSDALSFDGVADYVGVVHSASLNAYPITVSAWFKTTETGSDGRGIVNKYISLSYNGYQTFCLFGNLHAFYFADSANYIHPGAYGLNGGAVCDGEWHHMAFVVDAANGRLYTDGTLADSSPWTGSPGAPTTTQDLSIGRIPFEIGWWPGVIDDVRIYDRSLSQTEVEALAQGCVTDLAGNVLDGEYGGTLPSGDGAAGGDFVCTFTVDKPPTVVSVLRADADPTNAASVDFTVTFDQDVTGVDTLDFSLTLTGTVGGTVSNVTPVSATVYTVTVDVTGGDGTLRLDVDDDNSIVDSTANPLGGAGEDDYTGGEEYTIDRTPPNVVSIVRAGTDPTNATGVSFTVTFDSNVTGVGPADFMVTATGTAAGDVFATVPVTQSAYTVVANNVSGDGTLGLDLIDNDSILDAALNPLGGTGQNDYTGGEEYTVDNTGPTPPGVLGTTPTTDTTPTWTWTPGGGGIGQYRYGYAEGSWIGNDVAVAEHTPAAPLADGTHTLYVQERDALGNWSASGTLAIVIDTDPPTAPTVGGPAATSDTTPTWTWVSGSGGAGYFRYGFTEGDWIAEDVTDTEYTPAAPLGEGTHMLYVQERDDAGNWSASGSWAVVIDLTPPEVVSIVRADADPTNASSVDFAVTFDDAVTGVDATDFALTVAGTAAGGVSAVTPVDAQVYTVTVDGVTGDGTLRLDLDDDDSIIDDVSLPLGGVGENDYTSGETYTVDNTPPSAPTVDGVTPTDDTTPTWSWSTGGGGNGLCRYGYAEGDWIAEDVAVTEYTPPAALPDGTYTLYVQERDAAGNWSSWASFAITVDKLMRWPQDGGGCGAGGPPAALALTMLAAMIWLGISRLRRPSSAAGLVG